MKILLKVFVLVVLFCNLAFANTSIKIQNINTSKFPLINADLEINSAAQVDEENFFILEDGFRITYYNLENISKIKTSKFLCY